MVWGGAVSRGLGLIALGTMLVAGSLGITTTTASAAVGDYCDAGGSLPGLIGSDGIACEPDLSFDNTTIGKQCGSTNTFFNGSMCVADSASCEPSPGQTGSYVKGMCQISYAPPTPPSVTPPSGFTSDPNAGAVPTGELQPMCINASPFIGGGMFVVSGSVLCYEGAGRPTGIFGYTDGTGGSNGWNPFDRDSWDSLMVTKDLFAGDDITALGTITSYGGAQLFSLNGRNGVQVNDNGVLIRSVGTDGRQAGTQVTPGTINSVALDGLWSAGVTITANDETDNEIGRVTTTATNGTTAASTIVDATGTVTSIASNGTSTSSIELSSNGTLIRSSTVGNNYNEFGSAADTLAGSTTTNVIGAGGLGAVVNRIGQAGPAGSSVTNEIGTGNAGGATTNLIGNTNAATQIGMTAGTSTMTVIQGALDLGTGQGASILPSPTQQVAGGSSTVMLGSSSRHVVVDDAGRMTVINGVASQATTSMYIVNGHGTTNGVVVTETAATMSGGQYNPTSMSLTDGGVSFSNSSSGAPVRMSGIADGTGSFDAVNVRQLNSGVANVAALSALPAPKEGARNSLGLAMGYHGNATALALGGQSAIGEAVTLKYGAALSYSDGLIEPTASLGIGVSW